MAKPRRAPRHPAFQHFVTHVRSRLPELNFITIHYTYFLIVSLVSALIFWGSSKPFGSVRFIDALYLCVSAMTETGLNTVNISEINTFQQIILFVLMLIGSAIAVSAVVVFVRLQAFETAFVHFKKERQAQRAQRKQDGYSRATAFIPQKFTRDRAASDEKAPDEGNDTSKEDETENRSRSIDGRNGYVPEKEGFRGTPEGRDHADTSCDKPGPLSQQSDDQVGTGPSQKVSAYEVKSDDAPRHITFERASTFEKKRLADDDYERVHRPLISMTGVGATTRSTLRPRTSSNLSSARPLSTPIGEIPPPLLRRAATIRNMSAYNQKAALSHTTTGWISRNSQFHGLTVEEREKLGGREYRSLIFLSFLVPLYLIMWEGLGAISLGAYVKYQQADAVKPFSQSPFWAGSFMAISAFGNSGMSIVDANMVAFQNSAFLLVSMSLIILAGNTAYPLFLRSAIWVMWRVLPENDPRWNEDKATLRFLLDHPRRVYTNMFPSRQTWWLTGVLILLNGIDWMFFEVLSIGDQDIQNLSHTARVLGGLFQAFAVRSGGFYVVPIPTLRLSLQFLYVIMMYISVYPVTMTIRNSNVYEERSLGIFAEDLSDDNSTSSTSSENITPESPSTPGGGRLARLKRRATDFAQNTAPAPRRETRSYFLRQQLRAQLAHDAWFAVLAVFLILIIETGSLERDPVTFTVFNVLFEVVSAYGCVGLTIGLPNQLYSFSGAWHTLSKLILCAVMLRGRHRGLPIAIDHAIQLPGSRLWDAEDEDGVRRLEKMETMERQSMSRKNSQQVETPAGVVLESPTALRSSQVRERQQRAGQVV